MSTYQKLNKALLAVMTLLPLVSCSKGSSSNVPTTVLPTVTAIEKAKDPQAELDALAKASQSVDYSRISKGKCGLYAMVITPSDSILYKWGDNAWQPTAFPKSEFADPAIRVTTRDYTWDKVNDFLMNYQKGGPEGNEYGGILHLDKCKWRWADFDNANGSSHSVSWLKYDDETDTLSAFDLMTTDMGVPEDTYTDIYVRWEGDNEFALVYSYPDKFLDDSSSGSGSNQGSNRSGPTILRVECSLRDTGMSSSWSGTYYSWTYYNIWSNGTRTVAKMCQGYNPPRDC